MILADTSIWVDHLRRGDETLARLLEAVQITIHPFIIGEIALGHLRQRQSILESLEALPAVPVAMDDEVRRFIDAEALFGRGIGYVDVHLLASVRLSGDARLWTRDQRLAGVAQDLGLLAMPEG